MCMGITKISGTDWNWDPLTGCSPVSEGCLHCYAQGVTELRPHYFPMGFAPAFHAERLSELARCRARRRVFVGSMTDVFHEAHSFDNIARVFDAMSLANWHVYQVLTKRPERMADVVDWWLRDRGLYHVPRHIALGVTIESDRYCPRADILRGIPARTRFVSAEPLLGRLTSLDLDGIDWLIVGGESGDDGRPMDLEWALELRDRAAAERIPFFFKQVGGRFASVNDLLDERKEKAFPRSMRLGQRKPDEERRREVVRKIEALASRQSLASLETDNDEA